MSQITTLALGGLAATGLTIAAVPSAEAAPLPALSAAQVGGAITTVDTVGWRRGYYGPRYGYGYRRRNAAGALFAGAALGLIGGAIAASAAPRYYGGYGYYDYGYARPVGYYGYGYPAYGGYYGGYYPYGW